MAEMKRKRKFAERDSGYGQPFWISWYSNPDCRGKCISADSLRGDSDFRRFSDNVYPAAPGWGCAGIYGGLTAWRAGAVLSRNPRQPGRACRAAREPTDEASGVSCRGCLEDHCLVSEKRAAGCAARPMYSDHPKSHLGSGRHGRDEDAGISSIYHSREYGLESSSGWHRRSGRRCMGAGSGICESICGCGFLCFNSGNRMLSGIPFI